jgi:hypothetical protein
MLQKKLIGGVTYNDIPASAFDNIPPFTKPVTIGLHESRSSLLLVSQTRNPNDDSPIIDTNKERRHGRIFEKMRGEYYDASTGANSPIAVFEGNSLYCLDFKPEENVKVIFPDNPVHKQLYFFLHVCGNCKTTLSDENFENYKFQIIDFVKSIEEADSKEMTVLDVKNLIKEASTDEEMVINIAKDLGYGGTGLFKDARQWLMKLAETNPSDVKFAFSRPDVADLKRKIRRALKENIIVYRASDSKLAFDGVDGKALISATKNDDFEEKVQTLYRFLISAGNNDMFILFNKKIEEADLRLQETIGLTKAQGIRPSKQQTPSNLLPDA